MERSLTAKRVSTVRRVGWLGVASMLALALLAPAAGSVAAASVTPTNPAGNPTCTDLNPAWTLSFKIDTGDLENRAYDWNEGGDVESNWTGQTITLSGWSAEGQTFNWSSALPVNGVLVKGGNNNALYTYVPAVSGDTGLTHGPGQQAISHLLFCGDATPPPTAPAIDVEKVANPTEVPAAGGSVTYSYTVLNTGDVLLSDITVSDDKCAPVVLGGGDTNGNSLLDLTESWTFSCTTTITVTTLNTVTAVGHDGQTVVSDTDTATVTVLSPTAPPTLPPTAPPTAPPTVAPTAPPTAAPSQQVLAATGAPIVTLPPTDSLGGTAGPSDGSWRLALMAMAALLASVLVLTPAKATNRRR